jgi:ER membrane protein complex subunit 2
MGRVEQTVEELGKYLDTFYTDLEGWLELADIYSQCNQCVVLGSLRVIFTDTLFRYSHALEALSHALVLAPQNPFTFLQFAETAYTAGDVPLALKMFLVVVEMSERDQEKDQPPTGFTIRAWMGVKQVCHTIGFTLRSDSKCPLCSCVASSLQPIRDILPLLEHKCPITSS